MRVRLRIPDPVRPKKKWSEAEIRLLGTAPDSVVARNLGRNLRMVIRKRLAMDIANRFTPRAPTWTREQLAMLGKQPDAELAQKWGRTLLAVTMKRRQLRIRMN
jgi:hypothetical protein